MQLICVDMRDRYPNVNETYLCEQDARGHTDFECQYLKVAFMLTYLSWLSTYLSRASTYLIEKITCTQGGEVCHQKRK